MTSTNDNGSRHKPNRRIAAICLVVSAVLIAVFYVTPIRRLIIILLLFGPALLGGDNSAIVKRHGDLDVKHQQLTCPDGRNFEVHDMSGGAQVSIRYHCDRQRFLEWVNLRGCRVRDPIDTDRVPDFASGRPDEIVLVAKDITDFVGHESWRAGVVTYTFMTEGIVIVSAHGL